jgi:hypothetical protein
VDVEEAQWIVQLELEQLEAFTRESAAWTRA